MSASALRILLLAAVYSGMHSPGASDLPTTDVFVHGMRTQPSAQLPRNGTVTCTCLRIPSLASSAFLLFAFAECRAGTGDDCDTFSSDQRLGGSVASGRADGVPYTNVVHRASTDGILWTDLSLLVLGGSQPTAVFVPRSGRVLLAHRSSGGGLACVETVGTPKTLDAVQWTAPRHIISPTLANPALFAGPGNALVLSATHPIAPNRMILPVWVGPTADPDHGIHCNVNGVADCHHWNFMTRIQAYFSDDVRMKSFACAFALANRKSVTIRTGNHGATEPSPPRREATTSPRPSRARRAGSSFSRSRGTPDAPTRRPHRRPATSTAACCSRPAATGEGHTAAPQRSTTAPTRASGTQARWPSGLSAIRTSRAARAKALVSAPL